MSNIWDRINRLREKTLNNLKNSKNSIDEEDLIQDIKPDAKSFTKKRDKYSEFIERNTEEKDKYKEDLKEQNEKLENNKMNEIYDEQQYKLDSKALIDMVDDACIKCGLGTILKNQKSGFMQCDTCGNSEDIIISDMPEWRYYSDNNSNPIRCGQPVDPLLPKSSMSTMISGRGFCGIKRIHKWNNMPYHERSLYNTFQKIKQKANKGDMLGQVISDAKYYYKIIHDKDENYVLTRGDIRKGVIAACVYYACKKRNIARSDIEIADIFNINIRLMTKGCNKFKDIMWKKGHKIYFDVTSPLCYIERFCNIAGISEKHTDIGKFISYRCAKLGVSNTNTPLSISAGILYLLSTFYKYSLKKQEIYNICKISDVTISKCFKKLVEHIEFLLPLEEREKIEYLKSYKKKRKKIKKKAIKRIKEN